MASELHESGPGHHEGLAFKSMQINLATIEQHAGEKLRRIDRGAASGGERLAALRKFLKIETERLRLRHRFGLSGTEIIQARSLIVDLLIQRMAETAAGERGSLGEGLAVVALGGYGRRELAPHSDIDIMFLYGGRRNEAEARGLSEAILYLLWDVGFTVGHSLRSLRECMQMAKEDAVSRTALLDARLLWGHGALFAELTSKLEADVYRPRRAALLEEILAERVSRYTKFGEAVCMQEPNIKETAGGLRDVHAQQWALRLAGEHAAEPGAERAESEARALAADYDFLLRVRNEMHFLTGRRTDLLSFDLQAQAARNLGYTATGQTQASEVFMRDYYLHARRLHRLTSLRLQRATARPSRGRWFTRARQTAAVGGFVMRDGELDLAPEAQSLDGERLLLAFGYGQATGAAFSGSLQEAVERHLPEVNRRFRASAEAARAFLKLLRTRGRAAAVLRRMHDLGFLGKYLPEFARITCLVQHDLYHRYTIDEHTLRALEALDQLAESRSRLLERYRGIYAEIEDPAVLHLGLLLHDIGKGLGGGHTEKGVTIAERICARLHLEESTTEGVLFLIRHHLLMSHISQRRDLSDEKVIRDFAASLGTPDRLKMLCLLTYADTNGVGPGVWNEWKDALLWELYQKAEAALAPGAAELEDIEPLRHRIAQMLASEVDVDAVREHFRLLPDSYARQTPPQVIIEHIRLCHALNARPVRLSWRVNASARCTDLHLCARNRRGLFAAIAGTLAAQGVNILSVQLNTRTDGLAVDSLKVRDTAGEPITDPRRWELIETEIRRALSGETDIAEAVRRRLRAGASRLGRRLRANPTATRIAWDNRSSDRSTILEVRAADRPGLAYRIASALAGRDLDINFAKVATEKNLALDIFYVTDARGAKLPDAELPAIECAIRDALADAAA
ncbi:MAG: [protein-PII] uridylyltransferase [Blastocatellales bacterium]|nr:[protein-PII] uridylyltransferase [Blastocatellales bacterium]